MEVGNSIKRIPQPKEVWTSKQIDEQHSTMRLDWSNKKENKSFMEFPYIKGISGKIGWLINQKTIKTVFYSSHYFRSYLIKTEPSTQNNKKGWIWIWLGKRIVHWKTERNYMIWYNWICPEKLWQRPLIKWSKFSRRRTLVKTGN